MLSFSSGSITDNLQPRGKRPGQQFGKEVLHSLPLLFCMEASSSPGWPLDAPFAQGKTNEHFVLPYQSSCPKSSRALTVPVTSQMLLFCYSHKLSCLH